MIILCSCGGRWRQVGRWAANGHPPQVYINVYMRGPTVWRVISYPGSLTHFYTMAPAAIAAAVVVDDDVVVVVTAAAVIVVVDITVIVVIDTAVVYVTMAGCCCCCCRR